MTKNRSNDRYRIGYGKPPAHSRFRPGVSGNPTGKRNNARNLSSDVKRTLLVPVTLNDHGKSRKVSTQEAVLMRLREKALKGDSRSLDCLLNYAARFNNDTGEPGQALSSEDRAILESYTAEIAAASKISATAAPLGDQAESLDPDPEPPE